jgi:hypothetical protein
MLRSAYAIEKRVMGNTANAVLISERMIEFIITFIFEGCNVDGNTHFQFFLHFSSSAEFEITNTDPAL